MVKLEEKPVMFSNKSRLLAMSLASAVLAACGGGGSGGRLDESAAPLHRKVRTLPMLISDASSG